MLFMPFPVDTCVDYRGCKSPAVWLRKKRVCSKIKNLLRPFMKGVNLFDCTNASISNAVNFVCFRKITQRFKNK